MRATFNADQYRVLRRPLNRTRVAHRSQGGKDLSYLESWDVRAHLIRVLGYGNFDVEVTESMPVFEREVKIGRDEKPGIECAWMARVRLTIRNESGETIARYSECAVGSATGSVNYGDLHDNALKQAASDALKRCAINLGTQFGLSLYADGTLADVVRTPVVIPPGAQEAAQDAPGEAVSDEQAAALAHSLGATSGAQEGTQDRMADPADRVGSTS